MDLISRQVAYKVLTEYYHHKTEMQHKALREALDMVPSVDIDLSDYSDRLWRNAYEQGKAVSKDALDEAYEHGYTAAEADFHKKNRWIPVTADAVEVVRCRGCKWYDETHPYGTAVPDAYHCKANDRFYNAEHFCAYGERKEQ